MQSHRLQSVNVSLAYNCQVLKNAPSDLLKRKSDCANMAALALFHSFSEVCHCFHQLRFKASKALLIDCLVDVFVLWL